MANKMVLNRKTYKEIKKMDHQQMSNYLESFYKKAYSKGKSDAEGLTEDDLKKVLLSVKGIGEAKTKMILEAAKLAMNNGEKDNESE